jgi:enoyl-CoA hydratase
LRIGRRETRTDGAKRFRSIFLRGTGKEEAVSAIHCSRIGGHSILLEIDNPPTNALGSAMRKKLLEQLVALEEDLSIRAVVLTGRGHSFCSGDDLKERETALANSGEGEAETIGFARVLERLETFRVPTIAAVNGWAAGGGLELALCCDIRIASTEARFVCAAVNVGLIASAYRLPRLIGIGRAKHMLLTGSPHDAATAERFGLVTQVHAPDALLAGARSLAERIASRAPLSAEATKRVSSRALELSPEDAADAVGIEFMKLVASHDHAEALAAFREKREPNFERK